MVVAVTKRPKPRLRHSQVVQGHRVQKLGKSFFRLPLELRVEVYKRYFESIFHFRPDGAEDTSSSYSYSSSDADDDDTTGTYQQLTIKHRSSISSTRMSTNIATLRKQYTILKSTASRDIYRELFAHSYMYEFDFRDEFALNEFLTRCRGIARHVRKISVRVHVFRERPDLERAFVTDMLEEVVLRICVHKTKRKIYPDREVLAKVVARGLFEKLRMLLMGRRGSKKMGGAEGTGVRRVRLVGGRGEFGDLTPIALKPDMLAAILRYLKGACKDSKSGGEDDYRVVSEGFGGGSRLG